MITILLAFGLIEICRSSTKWDGIPFWWMNPIFSFSIKRSTTHLNLSNDQLHKTLVRLRKHVNIASYTWANELRLRIAMTTTSTWTTASQLLTCLQPPKFYLPWSSLPRTAQLWSGFGPSGTFLLDTPYLGSISSPSSELREAAAVVKNTFRDGGESSPVSLSNKWCPLLGILQPETWLEKCPTAKAAKKRSNNVKGKILYLMIMGVQGVKVLMVNRL